MTDQPETSDHRAPPSSAVGSAGRAPPGTASSPHAGRWFAGSTGAAGSTFAGPSFVPGAAGDPPLAAAVSLAAAYACGSIPTAFTLLWLGFDDPEVLLVWVVATAVVAAPMAAVVAAVGWRAERAMTGRVPPRPIAWVPLAVGVVGTAHWAPLCPWSPLLIGASMLSPSRAHVFLPLAVIGVVPWVLTTGALALAVLGRRSVVGRSWERATAADPGPSLVPTSVPAAIGYALSLAAPSALWLAWADEAFDRSRGSLAVIAWLLLGAGCG
ncbi:MAG: hypothetical protein ABMB14_27150, partial [Myxococcota bacterium]